MPNADPTSLPRRTATVSSFRNIANGAGLDRLYRKQGPQCPSKISVLVITLRDLTQDKEQSKQHEEHHFRQRESHHETTPIGQITAT